MVDSDELKEELEVEAVETALDGLEDLADAADTFDVAEIGAAMAEEAIAEEMGEGED